MLAKDITEGVSDLANRRVGLDGGNNDGHEVAICGRSLADPTEGAFPGSLIAMSPQLPDPLALRRLDSWIDSED